MKFIPLIAGVVLVSATCAWGKSFIVTSKGEGIWAASVRTETNVVLYYVPEGGQAEQSVVMNEIAGVVPSVGKGRQYTEQEISDASSLIENLARKFFKLRKNLIVLNQQWQSLRTPETGVEEKIGAIVKKFESSARDHAAFKDVSLQMDMIKFKDASGRYSNQVESALVQIGSAYFAANRAAIDKLLADPDTSVQHFLACKKEVDALKAGYLSDAQKLQLDTALQKCCDATIKAGVEAAKNSLLAGKTVDAYLESAGALRALMLATAEYAQPKDAVERATYTLRAVAARVCPGVDFAVKGCPLTEDDRRVLVEAKKFASVMPIRSLEMDEQAYMFPARTPGLPEGDTYRQPFRIVFNRTQPKNREYMIGGEIKADGGGKPKAFLWRVPALDIRDGHAEVMLEAPASRLSGEDVNFFLVYRADTAKEGEPAKWIALSLGCQIPVGKAK